MQTRIFRQLTLFAEFTPKPRRRPRFARPVTPPKPQSPCPGCGARNYDTGRFSKHLGGACVWCAKDYPVAMRLLCRERPVDETGCPALPQSRERILAYADRVKRGLSCFSPHDSTVEGMVADRIALYAERASRGLAFFDESDEKIEVVPMKRRGADGETGVERIISGNGSVSRWRARTYFRGRKFLLGTYDHEVEAVSRVRAWWKIHGGADLPPPVTWIPCSDDDRAFAIEEEHLEHWREQFPGVDARAVCESLVRELRKMRIKPDQIAAWNLLEQRLRDAVPMPVKIRHNATGGDDPAERARLLLESCEAPMPGVLPRELTTAAGG